MCEQFYKKLSLQEHTEQFTALHTHTQLQVAESERDKTHKKQRILPTSSKCEAFKAKCLVLQCETFAGDQTTDSTIQFSLTPLPANSLTVGVFRNAT